MAFKFFKIFSRSQQTRPARVSNAWTASGSSVRTGVRVTESTALTYSAFWAAVNIISDTIASLSWHVMTRDQRGAKTRDTGHPVDRLISRQPNAEMTAFSFRQTLQAHALTWGNAYAEIVRDGAGRPVQLIPITPDRVAPQRDDEGALVYEIRNDGNRAYIPARDMFHIRGLGFDGLVGYSVVRMARESIGLGLAAEQFGGSFFGNGTKPGGVLEHPGALSPESAKNLRESWESVHRGPANASKVAILEEGMTWKPMSVPPDDAQFLETRTFNVREMARWFRIPPHKLGDLADATFSNVEQMGLEYRESILPWAKKWEEEADFKLFGPQRDARRFTKLNLNSLLRADIKSRYEAYAIARQWGWMSADDILELEDRNPIEDGSGGMYLVPLNMVPSDQVGAMADAADGGEPDASNDEVNPTNDADDTRARETPQAPPRAVTYKKASARVFADAAARLVRKEANAAARAAKKHATDRDAFVAWADEWFGRQRAVVADIMLAPVEALAELAASERGAVGLPAPVSDSVRLVLEAFAQRHTEESCADAVAAYDEDDLAGLTELWEVERPARIAEFLTDQITTVASAAC